MYGASIPKDEGDIGNPRRAQQQDQQRHTTNNVANKRNLEDMGAAALRVKIAAPCYWSPRGFPMSPASFGIDASYIAFRTLSIGDFNTHTLMKTPRNSKGCAWPTSCRHLENPPIPPPHQGSLEQARQLSMGKNKTSPPEASFFKLFFRWRRKIFWPCYWSRYWSSYWLLVARFYPPGGGFTNNQ